ncbi:phosphatase PAP2 family protein [Flavobacterium sp. CHNK8]|uniref:phosphatase PAP2 family protein n=1 Tax=Flavobacterium sp. CHNK8 TaxID=2871165 RepID=UPI001C8EB0B6|nr:phosphatase PAP2 family protein [Flavobacterium sp. CHNK8]QZK90021.1 phosphatase PAP2 family protein [Flavobacterium sp. CHNK8]
MQKARIQILYCFFFLIGFSNLFSQNLDIKVLRAIHVERNQNFDSQFNNITNSAVPVSIATPVLMYSIGLIKKDSTLKHKAIFIGEAFLVNAFITKALKVAVNRARPFDTYSDIVPVVTSTGTSFPSGHTSIAFSTATSLSMAYPKWYVIVPSFLWASSVGYSRMHLGVHYPSDVAAGALIGAGSAFATFKINKWLNKKKFRKIEGVK